MQSKKNILIVCFSFPPFPGIGGRRWAKFAKYLAKDNFNVHVLAAENPGKEVSEWKDDGITKGIVLHTFRLGISKVLSFYPRSFFEKLIYKGLSVTGSLSIKGNKQDKLFFIKTKVLNQAEKIITENKIDTLIVTIPPYKLSYYLLPLKKKFPQVKFMLDYRDPWTDNRSYHGFAEISKEDLADEIEFEKEVLQNYDFVFDVNANTLETLRQKTQSKAKFIHLPNGFDSDDYKFVEHKEDASPTIRFIYSGSFYPNLIYLLQPIIDCLNKLEKTHPVIYKNLSFDFYGNMDHKANQLLKHSGCKTITFHGNLSQKRVLDEVNQSDFCMLFAATDHQHAFNTKFYDYLYLKRPILYFGTKGSVSEFIVNNNAGAVFEAASLEKTFYDFLISDRLKKFIYNKNIDISEFEIKRINQKLIEAINA